VGERGEGGKGGSWKEGGASRKVEGPYQEAQVPSSAHTT